MPKPLALLAYLGPNTVLASPSSFAATDVAAMAKVCRMQGFTPVLCKEEETKSSLPQWDIGFWDGKTTPEIVWIHQACPNIPGGVRDIHFKTVQMLADAIVKADRVFRLSVDNAGSMCLKQFLSLIKSKAKRTSFLEGEGRPVPEYGIVRDSILERIENGTFFEIGYPAAASNFMGAGFKTSGLFTLQIEMAGRILGGAKEKDLDFCYIGASRSDKAKQQARIDSIGSELIAHENSFFGGTLFGSAVRFHKAWDYMARSKAHVITRDSGMEQLPLHRYVQALYHEAIPVVVNEPEPVGFIHDPELQKLLRVDSYQDSLKLLESYEELKPLLRKEYEYWVQTDIDNTEKL